MFANGMKRNVFVDEPDSNLPAARLRAAIWRGSAISSNTMGASNGYFFSNCVATQDHRSPPRAHTSTYCLSSGSLAIPPHFKASVLVSIARQEQVGYLN
jgi:hypothetical protein